MRRWIAPLAWLLATLLAPTAAQAADPVAPLPAVVVYSAKDLGLQPDASVSPITEGDPRYEYRYTCLRLLDHVQGTWYLLPENWAFNHRLIMLGDDPDVRFELTGAEEDTPCPGLE